MTSIKKTSATHNWLMSLFHFVKLKYPDLHVSIKRFLYPHTYTNNVLCAKIHTKPHPYTSNHDLNAGTTNIRNNLDLLWRHWLIHCGQEVSKYNWHVTADASSKNDPIHTVSAFLFLLNDFRFAQTMFAHITIQVFAHTKIQGVCIIFVHF